MWGSYTKNRCTTGQANESMPNNPGCKVATPGCSRDMAASGDVCWWHSVRMAAINTFNCGCGKKWKTIDGDATGRMLRYQYSGDGFFAVVDMGNRFYCCSSCQNSDNYKWQCGSMFVCDGCASGHDRSKMRNTTFCGSSSDEDVDAGEWEHMDGYSRGVLDREASGKLFRDAIMTANGPTFQVKHPTEGALTVKSASTALIAAGYTKDVHERDWWLWIAGWYDDAPEALRNY